MSIWKTIQGLGVAAALCLTSAVSPIFAEEADAFITGDVTNDGVVSIDDAYTILLAYAQQSAGLGNPLTAAQITAADIDEDDKISISDAYYVLTYYAYRSVGTAMTWDEVICTSILQTPTLSIVNHGTTAAISWTGNANVSGYELYRDGTLLKTFSGASVTSYQDTGRDRDADYGYQVRSYLVWKGQTFYSEYSYPVFFQSPAAVLDAATLSPHNDFFCYDCTNGKDGTEQMLHITLTSADQEILNDFAAEHFTPHMTRAEQLWTVLEWIHYNVDYASTSEQWNAIANKTVVDAIFNERTGQCLQYNGAMCAMLVYLGYDAHMDFIRDTSNGIQHYICWITVNGKEYNMETGNYGKNGDWLRFVYPVSVGERLVATIDYYYS